MSNVIQFPMERIQISTKLINFFSDRVDDQLSDLEAQSLDILDQAIALEKQSQRILDSLED
jgi:hypothetical protein